VITKSPSTLRLARFNLDGSFDNSFGIGGQVTVGSVLGSNYSGVFPMGALPQALAVQNSTGDIYVAGGGLDFAYHLAVAKYDRNGNILTSFGNDGIFKDDANQYNGSCATSSIPYRYESVFPRADGSFYSVAYVSRPGGIYNYLLAKHLPNGGID